jgi:2-phosphoglycerate kinase
VKGLLIGGTSHCGKSTLAQKIGAAQGWRVVSTDQLARHPGRPWLGVPEPVMEFYETLSPQSIYWFLRVHHTNMWPLLQRVIADEQNASGGFVLEGSALRPEHVATLTQHGLLTVCLHAAPDFLRERIRRESGYDERDVRMKHLIDIFVERSLRDNEDLAAAAEAAGVWLIDVADPAALAQAELDIIERLGAAR